MSAAVCTRLEPISKMRLEFQCCVANLFKMFIRFWRAHILPCMLRFFIGLRFIRRLCGGLALELDLGL